MSTERLSRVRASAAVARARWWKAQNPSETPMKANFAPRADAFLDLEADEDDAPAAVTMDGVAYLRRWAGTMTRTVAIAWLVQVEVAAREARSSFWEQRARKVRAEFYGGQL